MQDKLSELKRLQALLGEQSQDFAEDPNAAPVKDTPTPTIPVDQRLNTLEKAKGSQFADGGIHPEELDALIGADAIDGLMPNAGVEVPLRPEGEIDQAELDALIGADAVDHLMPGAEVESTLPPESGIDQILDKIEAPTDSVEAESIGESSPDVQTAQPKKLTDLQKLIKELEGSKEASAAGISSAANKDRWINLAQGLSKSMSLMDAASTGKASGTVRKAIDMDHKESKLESKAQAGAASDRKRLEKLIGLKGDLAEVERKSKLETDKFEADKDNKGRIRDLAERTQGDLVSHRDSQLDFSKEKQSQLMEIKNRQADLAEVLGKGNLSVAQKKLILTEARDLKKAEQALSQQALAEKREDRMSSTSDRQLTMGETKLSDDQAQQAFTNKRGLAKDSLSELKNTQGQDQLGIENLRADKKLAQSSGAVKDRLDFDKYKYDKTSSFKESVQKDLQSKYKNDRELKMIMQDRTLSKDARREQAVLRQNQIKNDQWKVSNTNKEAMNKLRATKLQREISQPPKLTKGQEALDVTVGKDIAGYDLADGKANADSAIRNMTDLAREMLTPEGKKMFKGAKTVPEFLGEGVANFFRPMLNADLENFKDRMANIINKDLRVTLGAQFTENEGAKFLRQSFNPKLSAQENLKRAMDFVKTAQQRAVTRDATAKHFNKNGGTMHGYTGKLPSSARTMILIDSKSGKALPPMPTQQAMKYLKGDRYSLQGAE